jgi:hypothetical protein
MKGRYPRSKKISKVLRDEPKIKKYQSDEPKSQSPKIKSQKIKSKEIPKKKGNG